MQITGRCHCGEVTYQAQVDENKVFNCHCTDCQIISGAPFRTVVISMPDAVIFTGATPKEYIKIAESGNQRAQGFCANCGTALYATSVGEGERIYGLRLGAVEQAAELIPNTHIWYRSHKPWLDNLADMSTFEITAASQ
ncbi:MULTISPECIES: GFA family protein [Pseudoalteromonas]|uniref:GFA family protein n=1 Tax=Pseudoalteromonas TaxID=53246 RepID=UPI00094F8B22|nr:MULTISPECIES: GFA family protein [Pseudoalteromonas]|tara:strand:+ start:3785 stop:4201 length:417 start_codon:yes stop_codon:yes gene_type:complete